MKRAFRLLLAVAAMVCAAALWPVRAQESFSALFPGADTSDCHSALRTGPTRCSGSVPLKEPSWPGDVPTNLPPKAEEIDARIDAFLANYGKPPREAVRALLEPTDMNILAMLRNQQQVTAIADYVATRMTELQGLQERGGFALPFSDRARVAASLLQMRVTLFERPRDPLAADALSSLRSLCSIWPSLQGRVGLVGRFSAAQLRVEVGQIPAPVVAGSVDPGEIGGDDLPYFVLEDLRDRRVERLEADGMNARRLLLAIVDLRQRGTAPHDRARSPGATQSNASIWGDGPN